MTLADAREVALGDEEGVMICAGRSGDWSFALQHWGVRILEEGVVQQVSAGTTMVVLISTASAPAFMYVRNGSEICGFDPGLPHLRYGTDPDRFRAEMARAGLPTDSSPVGPGVVPAMLRFAGDTFGLSLSQFSVLRDELLTGRVPEHD